jgi:CDP-diacylglycerol pyrophosphatase
VHRQHSQTRSTPLSPWASTLADTGKAGFVAACFLFADLVLVCVTAAGCARGNPDALWQIVHDRCVPDEKHDGNPAPCAAVDLSQGEAGGSAVLKDRNGPYQYLLIPTSRVSGIESEAPYAADAPNYFAAAWAARGYVEKGLGQPLPREMLGLALNSRYARSQNQLHIHVDCLRPDVRAALQAQLPHIGDDWSRLPQPLAGDRYRARRIYDADLTRTNPFRLLPAAVRDDPDERARHTLVVAGVHFAGGEAGFVLLDGRASWWPPDTGHGEDLQDHACR